MIDGDELLELYASHFKNPARRPDTALSIEALGWLNLHGLPEAVERLGPIRHLADLGTGLSSAFYRLWMLRGQTELGTIWSVDTDPTWLERSQWETAVRLGDLLEVEDPALHGFEGPPIVEKLAGRWLTLGAFEIALELNPAAVEETLGEEMLDLVHSFQVVSLDTAKAFRRPKLLGLCDELLVPGGLLILDDWHMAHHREPSSALLKAGGYEIQELELETTDEYGRYLAVAWRPT